MKTILFEFNIEKIFLQLIKDLLYKIDKIFLLSYLAKILLISF